MPNLKDMLDPEQITKLTDLDITNVDLVGQAANGRRFVLMKSESESGMFTPADVKAMAERARASVEKNEQETAVADTAVTKDEIDPTDVDLTEALEGADVTDPGQNTPGSSDWETVDAESAGKWIQVLGWAKNALEQLADRELVEADLADPDDYENSWNLQDASCAIDYAIGILAQYKVSELAEATIGAELQKQVSDIAKAVSAFNPDLIPLIDGYTAVQKAGRVLSAANQTSLEDALKQLDGVASAIQKVLNSLPTAPEETAAKATQSGDREPDNASEAVDADPDVPEEGNVNTQKAKGDPQILVYDQDGNVIGSVDPANLTQFANSATPSSPDASSDTDATDDTTDPTTDDDTSADSTDTSGDDAATIPGTDTVQSPAPDTTSDEDVTKGFAAQIQKLEEVLTPLAEKVGVAADLADVVKGLQERVDRIAKMPDDRNSPKLFGATGAGAITRDGDVDPLQPLRKAVEDAKTDVQAKDAKAALAYAMVKGRFTA